MLFSPKTGETNRLKSTGPSIEPCTVSIFTSYSIVNFSFKDGTARVEKSKYLVDTKEDNLVAQLKEKEKKLLEPSLLLLYTLNLIFVC